LGIYFAVPKALPPKTSQYYDSRDEEISKSILNYGKLYGFREKRKITGN
jgi:hypothetical protein